MNRQFLRGVAVSHLVIISNSNSNSKKKKKKNFQQSCGLDWNRTAYGAQPFVLHPIHHPPKTHASPLPNYQHTHLTPLFSQQSAAGSRPALTHPRIFYSKTVFSLFFKKKKKTKHAHTRIQILFEFFSFDPSLFSPIITSS